MPTLRTLSALVLALGSVACGNWNTLAGPPAELADTVQSGTYRGDVSLEVRVFAGPLRVKHLTCGGLVDITVDELGDEFVEADVPCEGYDAHVEGILTDDLTIDGTVTIDGVELEWEGRFDAYDGMYGEAAGERTESSLRFEYAFFVDAVLDGAE